MRTLRWVVAFVVVSAASLNAWRLAWLSDDAFISFRYAQNLVHGHGLLFNAGERVEGVTNALWTLMVALGLLWGIRPETTTTIVGIVSYAGCVGLLVVVERWLADRFHRWPAYFPCAPLLAAADPDWATFATSGLETSLFTTTCFGGYLLLALPTYLGWRASAGAGFLFATAAAIRPEGAWFGVLAGVVFALPRNWAHSDWQSRIRSGLAYALAFALPFGAFTAWRFAYYGELVPNTYYAKSANLSWWSQGLTYVGFYAYRHAIVLGLTALASALVLFRHASADKLPKGVCRALAIAATMAVGYFLYVAEVGGDFMYARFLVPTTPLYLVAFTILLHFGTATWPAYTVPIVGSLAGLALFFSPCPVGVRIDSSHGIVDERAFYRPELTQEMDVRGEKMRRLTAGIPITAAMYASGARTSYRAQFPVVVEAEGGLTDPYVAHMPLLQRGRVGHEKLASPAYLILRRRAQITMEVWGSSRSGLDKFIPLVLVEADGIQFRLLYWDITLVANLERRGAIILGFPASLDDLIIRLPRMCAFEVRREWARYDHFYFAHVEDAPRRAAFEHRLAEIEQDGTSRASPM